jgi:hypothetical protein
MKVLKIIRPVFWKYVETDDFTDAINIILPQDLGQRWP